MKNESNEIHFEFAKNKIENKIFPMICHLLPLQISISNDLRLKVTSFGAKEMNPSAIVWFQWFFILLLCMYKNRTRRIRTARSALLFFISFIYFIEKSRYIYRHKSEPTPPPTTKMMIKHTLYVIV